MKSGAPRSSSVARCSSPVASASPIAGSSCGTLLSSAASTSANFLLVSIFTCSTCNTCRVMVGSAIALSISVGQFADKPGQIHFRILRLKAAFQRGLQPVLGLRFAHALVKEIGIAAEVLDRRERNRRLSVQAICSFGDLHEPLLDELCRSRHGIRIDLYVRQEVLVSPAMGLCRRATKLDLHAALLQI